MFPSESITRPESIWLPGFAAGSARALFDATPQPMLICSRTDQRVLAANDAAARLYGSTSLEGRRYPGPALPPAPESVDEGRVETHRCPDGASLVVLAHHLPLQVDGELVWLVALTRAAEGAAVHRRRERAERRTHRVHGQLRLNTHSDPETGLLNLRGFLMTGDLWLAVARRVAEPAVLLVVRVANIPVIRESVGSTACAGTLRALAVLLQQNFRESDVLARVGHGTFAALLMAPDREAALVAVDRLQRTLHAWNAAHSDGALCLAFGAAPADYATETPATAWQLGRAALADLWATLRR
jgi:diguanylate cyclase (GGDEF)-like protein